MLQGKNKTDQDYIIECLAKGSQDITGIYNYIRKHRTITRPAIYDQLRKLRVDGIILKNKTKYLLSKEWIDSLQQVFTSFDAPILKEGENISYSFNSLGQMDAYWKHIFPLYDSLYNKPPICIYNKHCFWVHILGRTESEEQHYTSYTKDKRTAFFLIGDTQRLDKEFKKKYQNDYFKINIKTITANPDTHHVTIVGDIIINSQLPKSFVKKINTIYEDVNSSPQNQIIEIRKLCEKNIKMNLRIERNRKRAEKLKKIITKDFVLTKNLKEKLYL